MKEEIEFVRKDPNSFTGNCPALFRVPGGYYTQGKVVTSAEVRDRLRELGAANDCPCGEDEDYLFIPANVIDGASSQ
jgi:hypothetical protein